MTTPELYALAHGLTCAGPHRCFYCGAPCDGTRPVPKNAAGTSGAARPASPWSCEGCVLCFRDAADLAMLDGSRRHLGKNAVRSFSWLVTGAAALAGSKADLARWREACLNPPEPPFSVVLSDSGQKHLLYRGAVCLSRAYCTATLELERIDYSPAGLARVLADAGAVAAARGKPCLSDAPGAGVFQSVHARYGHCGPAERWAATFGSPLSRLAAWLCPAKEECERLYPAAAA